MYDLGAIYFKGYGTEQNVQKAKEWFQKAVDLNHPYAELILKQL